MRVQENPSSTSCAKMTEERSLNGGPDVTSNVKRTFVSDGKKSPSLSDVDKPHITSGGRLKFFKDGKFILELSHRREGERNAWMEVPKKTYWPPTATVSTPRQESSTSLSVSDDNSSIQSSPWQPDHCWKQTTPRRWSSLELTFHMRAPPHIQKIRRLYPHIIKRKQRCPFDQSVLPQSDEIEVKPCLAWRKRAPRSLAAVVQALAERRKPSNPSMVSPRKRILREMERVSLEDLVGSKRQRPRQTNNSNTVTCQTLQPAAPQPSKGSSYSITSLLAEDSPPSDGVPSSFLRTLLKSPSEQFVTPPPASAPLLYASYLPHHPHTPHMYYHNLTPPMWMQYPPGLYSPCHWAPTPAQSLQHYRKDDATSDVPLNLSKHSG